MELSWLQSLFLGLISGFTEVLPVSAQAHRLVILKFLGVNGEPALLRLMIHLSTVAALHFCCRNHIVRMMRAQRLALIPKKRRKRPLDSAALMDFNLLKTTLIPVVLAFVLYFKVQNLSGQPMYVALFLGLNGLLMYLPPYLPGSNKESGAMTRVDGLIMGLGSAASVLPGISCVGAAASVGQIRGMELKKCLNLALVMSIPVNIGFAVYDVMDLLRSGFGGVSFGMIISCILAAAAAFAGVVLGIRALLKISENLGLSVFGFYSWGMALLTFVLYITGV